MKPFIYVLVLLAVVLLTGCGTNITKEEFAPKIYTERPTSILVLPPINKTTAADAKEYYSTTVTEPLANDGYYVFPMEIVNDVLQQEGLYDTETMLNVQPQKFKEYFGADAVLYVTIEKWNTSYLITAGSVTVKAACELRSTLTGEVIWFYDDEVTINTSGDSGGQGGLLGFIVSAVSTAIKTATQSYVPLAMQANEAIFKALPYGKYHKEFNQDHKMKIKKKDKKVEKTTDESKKE